MIPGIVASANKTFDPIGSIPWAWVVWAGDPAWSNPGNGNPVDSWRNGGSLSGDPASTGSNRPTFRASTAAFNNKPTVEFVMANSTYLDFDITNTSQPFSIVVIGSSDVGGGQRIFVGGFANAARGLRTGGDVISANYAQVLSSAAGANTGAPMLLRGFGLNTSSVIAKDGTTIATGDAGNLANSRLTLGAGSSAAPAFGSYLNGHIAFAALIAGDVMSQANWPLFKEWAKIEYNIATII